MRSILSESQISQILWPEAILTATYLTNLLPYKNNVKTPSEIWYNKKPDISNLKIFGCLAYVRNKAPENKCDKRAIKCVMLDYTLTGYKLWNIEKKQIIISRDVIFDENKFYFQTLNINNT